MRIRLSDLQPGADYAVQLRANDGSDVSEWSVKFPIVTDSGAVQPNPPSGVTWTMQGTSMLATWVPPVVNVDGSAFKDFSHYEIQVSVGATIVYYNTTQPRFDFSISANRAAFGVPRPSVNFRVRTANTSRLVSDHTDILTTSDPLPSTPTGFVADGKVDLITLRWTANPEEDIAHYNVYASQDPAVAGTKISSTKATGYVWPTTTGNLWYFRLFAVDAFAQESAAYATANAQIVSMPGLDTTPPANPTSLTPTQAFDQTRQSAYINLTWPASVSTDVDTYRIRYSNDGTNWQYVNVPGDQTSVRLDNLNPNTTYTLELRTVDFSGNLATAWLASTPTTITTIKDTTAPSQPAAPTVASSVQRIQVSHSLLKQSGGALESDLDYFEIFASITSGFAATDANMLGTMKANVVAIETFNLPASSSTLGALTQTWYVLIRAVDKSGNKSAFSPQATATPGLVGTLNITELDAARIKANTAFIGDLSVKSTFTLGDATTDGKINSFGYVAGSTGFSLAKSGLEINQGSISAAALKIQDSHNILPAHYADFEYHPGFYSTSYLNSGPGVVASIDLNNRKFNNHSLKAEITATDYVWLGPADIVSPSFEIEGGSTYIASWYSMVPSGTSVTQSLTFRGPASTDAFVNLGTSGVTTGNGIWVRHYGTFVVPAGTTAMGMFFNLSGISTIFIDGFLVEKKIGALNTPSQWKPPGATIIDGNAIKTGTVTAEQIHADYANIISITAEQINGGIFNSNLLLSHEIRTRPSDNVEDLSFASMDIAGFHTGGLDGIENVTLNGIENHIKGILDADSLNVFGPMVIESTSSSISTGAAVTLASVVTPPPLKPTLTISYPQRIPHGVTGVNHYGLFYDALGGDSGNQATFWSTRPSTNANSVGDYRYVQESSASTGAHIRTITLDAGNNCWGVVRAGNWIWVLYSPDSTTSWYLSRYTQSTLAKQATYVMSSWVIHDNPGLGFITPAQAGNASGLLTIMTTTGTGTAVSPRMVKLPFDTTTGAAGGVSTTTLTGLTVDASKTEFSGIVQATEPGINNGIATYWIPIYTYSGVVGGTKRKVYAFNAATNGAAAANSYVTTGIDFPGEMGAEADGLAHDGTSFYSSVETNKIVRHTNWSWPNTTSSTKWFAYSWNRDVATFAETIVSPVSSIVHNRRARITVGMSARPAAGANGPTNTAVYTNQGSTQPTANSRFDGRLHATVTGTAYYCEDIGPLTGTQNISPGTFTSNGLPAGRFLASANGFLVDGLSDGNIGTGTFGRSARPAGEITMFGGATVPSGWVLCDGRALPRPIVSGGSADTYKDLFATIGTTFGFTSSTTPTADFKVPDLRGRFPMGVGGIATVLGDDEGVTNSTLRTTAHTHNLGTGGGTTTSGSAHIHSITDAAQHRHSISDSGNHNHDIADVTHGVNDNTAIGGAGNRVTQIGPSGGALAHSHGGRTTGTTDAVHNHNGLSGNEGIHNHGGGTGDGTGHAHTSLSGITGVVTGGVDENVPFIGVHFIIKT